MGVDSVAVCSSSCVCSRISALQAQVLEKLMAVRHQLALQVGFESHAHRMTSEKMAESPGDILRFLETLSAGIRNKAEQEVTN